MDEAPIQLEHLEFGKECRGRNGPILPHEDHRFLGASNNFPQAAIPNCDPRILGVLESPRDADSEQILAPNRPGFIIRPFHHKSVVCQVAAQVGVRPEQPEGDGRLYTLARYLAAPGEVAVPPSAIYAAVSEELAGLDASDIKRIAPVPISLPAGEPLAVKGNPFLEDAVAHILSGVSVAVREVETAAKFFRMADGIYFALPEELRIWFSAGWNVSSKLASRLWFSWSDTRPEWCAIYNTAACNWELRSVEARLTPGRSYLYRKFKCGAPPATDTPPKAPKPDDAARRDGIGALPDRKDAALKNWFMERAEFGSAEELIEQILTLLKAGQPASNFALRLLDDDDNPRRPLQRALLAGLRDHSLVSKQHDLLEQLFWTVCSHKRFVGGAELPPWGAMGLFPRLRLLLELAESDPEKPLDALRQFLNLAAERQAAPLPVEAGDRLKERLSSSVRDPSQEIAELHGEFLCLSKDQIPALYLEWLAMSGQAVAWALAQYRLNFWKELRDCIQPDPVVEMMARVCQYEAPTNEDLKFAPSHSSRLASLLRQYWNKDLTSERTRNLLAWSGNLPSKESDPPLLKLAFSNPNLAVEALHTILAEHGEAALPDSLRSRLALQLKRFSENPDLARLLATRHREWPSVILADPTLAYEVGKLAGLVAPAAARPVLDKQEIERAWEKLTDASQIMKYLIDFPDIDFVPSVDQLVALLRLREELREYLKSCQNSSRQAFRIASLEFFGQSWEQRDSLWKAEYSGKPLWAAFNGCPLAHRTSLPATLEAYEKTPHKKAVLAYAFLIKESESRGGPLAGAELFNVFLMSHIPFTVPFEDQFRLLDWCTHKGKADGRFVPFFGEEFGENEKRILVPGWFSTLAFWVFSLGGDYVQQFAKEQIRRRFQNTRY